jgi:hypothetical protein
MNFAESHSASDKEISSIPITRRDLWTSARGISRPVSPSELSAISEQLSNVSHFDITSSDPGNSSTSPIHSHPESTSASRLLPDISDSTAHISIPQFPLSTESRPPLPKSKMTNQISSLGQMPLRHTKQAPQMFKGEYRKVARFIEHYTHLLEYHQVTSDSDKCRGILEYCSQGVEDFILSCPGYRKSDWEKLKEEILKYYDADLMKTRIQLPDLIRFLQEQVKTPIKNLTQWMKYNRKYLAQASFLKRNDQIDETEFDGYFWYGIHEGLRSTLEVRLQNKYPTHDTAIEPWSVAQVQEVAETYLKRNTYSDRLYHLPALGVQKRFEDEDEDEDNDNHSDDEDDYEEERRPQRKKKNPKKKSKPLLNLHRTLPQVQITKEEPSRRIVPPPEDGRIEDIIHQLNTMSLEDPHYGSLYYKAIKDDHTGLVAQCITRKPGSTTLERTTSRAPPPHQNQPPPTQPRYSYPRGIFPQIPGQYTPGNSMQCYGCFGTGHRLRDCPKMANLVFKKIITLDNNFRYRFADGEELYRRPEESFAQTVERMRPQHQVQYVTSLGEAVENYYNKAAKRKYQQYSDSEDDDDDDESEESSSEEEEEEEEEEPYEDARWSWRSERRREYPTYVAYEAIDEEDEQETYEAYPVERSDRTTRQARATAMNEPTRKPKFDGVYMPPRRYRGPVNNQERPPVKNPEPAPVPVKPISHQPSDPPIPFKPKENILPNKPLIPFDARKPRFKEVIDVEMNDPDPVAKENKEEKRPVVLQDYPPPSKPADPQSE